VSCRVTELLIDCRDPRALAAWWCDVLGYRIEDEDEDDGAIAILGGPGSGPVLVFQPVPEEKTVKNRLHLDLNATDQDQAAELERLLGLGARQVDVGQRGDESWHVLADPEGNEFCLLQRTVDPTAPLPLEAPPLVP
jgi:hypothetical protein